MFTKGFVTGLNHHGLVNERDYINLVWHRLFFGFSLVSA